MMGISRDEKCLLFFQTLRGRATEWFHNLPAGEIDSFDELAEVFQENFKENCSKRKKFTYLSTAGQREHEDLTKFLTWWKDEVDKVEEMNDKTAMSLLLSGLRSGELYKEFCQRPPQSYQEAYNMAWDYADTEAHVSSKREAEQGHSKGRISLKKDIELPGRVKAEVMEVKPAKAEKKLAGEKQWTEKYCSFHKTDSHNTVDCNSVKGVIKKMIEAGELDPEYLAHAKQKKNQWIRPEGQPAEQNKKKKAAGKEHLQVIYGGPEGGDSASQRKKWGLELYVGTVASADGSILLTCELGMGDKVILKQMRFVVVNIKCVHNAILGRPGINKVRGIISMAHLCMKFYTPGGIGQVRGDQKKARSYYLEAVKKMTKAFERVTLVSQEEDRSKLESGDETKQIVLREAFPERMVRIGRDLPGGLLEEINSVLREFAGIFAWSVADILGINRSIICHRYRLDTVPVWAVNRLRRGKATATSDGSTSRGSRGRHSVSSFPTVLDHLIGDAMTDEEFNQIYSGRGDANLPTLDSLFEDVDEAGLDNLDGDSEPTPQSNDFDVEAGEPETARGPDKGKKN
ncbi:unnamed protein product [Cuscuta campestris]|uniref:Retrotransposon gag domain-containing protein n=1 Tax=Cuscuta campestris TaxID=132261 RepID=A0A484LSX1_9ASTE|nr:unnamed protein product [Cuscuta campestris]